MKKYTVRLSAPPMSATKQPDGSMLIRDARITHPKRLAGQVRDVTVRADGSIHLGADKNRGAA